MNSDLQAAVEALCLVLDRENAALRALDPVRAGGFLVAKRAATDALLQAGERHAGTPPLSVAEARRLRDLAAENRRLLERAIMIQGRVIAVVARAAPRPRMAPRYAANGAMAYAGRPIPMALSARA
jgi:hypothetical protein